MSMLVAAARVFARAAALQAEEAARVAGPVAVQRALAAERSLATVEDVEAVHYPAAWAASSPSTTTAATTEAAALQDTVVPPTPSTPSVPEPLVAPAPLAPPPPPAASAPPAPSSAPSPPPPPPHVSELQPPAVKVARVVRVTAAPLPQPVVIKAPDAVPEVVLAAPTPVDVKEAAPTPSEIEERVSAAVEDGFLARAEDAASKLPPIEGDEEARPALRSSTVPSSRLGRLFHYGSLAASLGIGAATETIRRTAGGGGEGSVFMSDANVRRLVATLSRMRGAALKLGQFMSMQDNTLLPPELERVLQQVQAHANYMPDWQMEKVLSTELGKDWATLFGAFDRIPVASASIGQVHRATLPDGTPVAVKIQFPGVAGSINSDLANMSVLLRGSAVLPKGLYLQNTISVMRRELEDECDYVREAAAGERFHMLLKGDPVFEVPAVVRENSTARVLTTGWMPGRPLSKIAAMDQETRDRIGTAMMRLCLRELFEFRFMQTDPNWANFLYDPSTQKIQLIDFGASRAYTKEFMDGWYRLLTAALRHDRAAMKAESEALGYLTGEEEEVMVDAHIASMAALAKPFRHEGTFPFADQTVTDEVRAHIPVMLKHRLTPPPAPTYSLNRKLSGAFLMCAKLGANVDCKTLWEEVVGGYVEGPIPGEEEAQALLMAEAKA